eukprot:4105686-Alexandrium_andersonii.AAC.1
MTARKQVVGDYKKPVPLWDLEGFKLRGSASGRGSSAGGKRGPQMSTTRSSTSPLTQISLNTVG